jgi:hypothetical protein
MANNLHISYDLYRPNQDYAAIIARIKSLGDWIKIHKSLWYVKSSYSAIEAVNYLSSSLDGNDTLYVVDATNNRAAWKNVHSEASKALVSQWSRQLV